mmetsp:Transcript_18474/g.46428  ORF Transcript_18474/g.46428 Transcript_18474/m.46428 type:complete len:198 (+) Transcript_18474:267-860(+)
MVTQYLRQQKVATLADAFTTSQRFQRAEKVRPVQAAEQTRRVASASQPPVEMATTSAIDELTSRVASFQLLVEKLATPSACGRCKSTRHETDFCRAPQCAWCQKFGHKEEGCFAKKRSMQSQREGSSRASPRPPPPPPSSTTTAAHTLLTVLKVVVLQRTKAEPASAPKDDAAISMLKRPREMDLEYIAPNSAPRVT